MQRRFRLTNSTDFQRVRRLGKSQAHPLLVLAAFPNPSNQLRFGVITSRSLGKAVVRNHARRLLRAALQASLPEISPGWDVVLIARRPLTEATYPQVLMALATLLKRAGLCERSSEING